MTSPYLLRPLRTEAQAAADIAKVRAKERILSEKVGWFRREPTMFAKMLALHVIAANDRSALT